ncbi:MAG: AbrB/MazE/SpoVT family DNA-binding domain-containing protein [Candidatus Bathyarchaeia archaeon]
MLEEEMKVCPKGQVVIPRALRKALKIYSGSRVRFKLEGERLILEKQPIDPITIFESVAKKGPSIGKFNEHAYREELAKRFRKCST